jgi:hypothetical protein
VFGNRAGPAPAVLQDGKNIGFQVRLFGMKIGFLSKPALKRCMNTKASTKVSAAGPFRILSNEEIAAMREANEFKSCKVLKGGVHLMKALNAACLFQNGA